jgi:protein-tyrosine phosphatase
MSDVGTSSDQLRLDGVFNFRDLGGLSTVDGRATVPGRLFRADGLHRSPAAERGRLRDLGITQVVDLRTRDEIDREGRFEADGVRWVHSPVFQSLRDFAGAGSPGGAPDLLCHHFEHMVATNAEPLAAAIGSVAEAVEGGPVVFHCTAGKDRTGVVAALILAGVGVADHDVAGDFARSAGGVRQMVDWYRRTTGTAPTDRMAEVGIDPSMADVILGAEPATMVAFLDRLRVANGDVDRYLASIGADGAVARIERVLLAR